MTDPNYTDITVILDRSGSMESIKTDTIGGFYAFMEEQRQQSGKALVTLVQFDNYYDEIYTNKDVAEVPPLQLEPRGGTALLDAIGRTINRRGAYFASLPEEERPGAVVVLIFTDGLENASHEFTRQQIKDMISEQESAYSWVFTYLGSNQDAVLVGESMGFNASRSMTYSGTNSGVAMAAAASMTSNIRNDTMRGAGPSAGAESYGYSSSARIAAVGGTPEITEDTTEKAEEVTTS